MAAKLAANLRTPVLRPPGGPGQGADRAFRQLAMDDPIKAFALSLDLEEPPPFATPPLRALWHGLRGDWDTAHELAQVQDDTDGAWVHAWLHRIEGDLGNADYWYRRAGREPRRGETREEGLEIAQALIRSAAGTGRSG